MTNKDVDEINEFIRANPIRLSFVPLMEHIKKLSPKKFDIVEYGDKDGNTSSIQYAIDVDDEDTITGRVSYDWASPDRADKVIFELWWDEECYCLASSVKEITKIKNLLTILIKKIKFANGYLYRDAVHGGKLLEV